MDYQQAYQAITDSIAKTHGGAGYSAAEIEVGKEIIKTVIDEAAQKIVSGGLRTSGEIASAVNEAAREHGANKDIAAP